MTSFRYWSNPKPYELGDTVEQFVLALEGPVHIHLFGRDSSRCRVAVTLLHGNEPSGLIAMYRFMKAELVPTVDVHFYIVNVKAALEGPGFYYRMLPGSRDLNRCFGEHLKDTSAVANDEPGQLAKALLDCLREVKPEAVIDIHNTSGDGPAFAVTTFMDARHDAIASLFTHRLIVTQLKLGALMEVSETLFPTVTVECGGAQQEESHLLAFDGLEKFCGNDDVLSEYRADIPMQYFHNPIRLELNGDIAVNYGDHLLDAKGITLKTDIEHYNFGIIEPSAEFGYLQPELMQWLTAKDIEGNEKVHDFFHVVDGKLKPKQALYMFMVTGNPSIAKSDCFFYFIPV